MKLNPSFAAGYASPSGAGFRKVVKCTIMIKKKVGMSDEDFVAYYNTRHARMATEVVLRYRPITYSLVSGTIHAIQEIGYGLGRVDEKP